MRKTHGDCSLEIFKNVLITGLERLKREFRVGG